MAESSLNDVLNHTRFSLLAIVSKTKECLKDIQLLKSSNVREKSSVDNSIAQLLSYHNHTNSMLRGIVNLLSEYSSDSRISELSADIESECTIMIPQACYAIGSIVHRDDHTNRELPKLIESIKDRLAYIIEYCIVKSDEIALKIQ